MPPRGTRSSNIGETRSGARKFPQPEWPTGREKLVRMNPKDEDLLLALYHTMKNDWQFMLRVQCNTLRDELRETMDQLSGDITQVICPGLGSMTFQHMNNQLPTALAKLVLLESILESQVPLRSIGKGAIYFQDPEFNDSDRKFLSFLGYSILNNNQAFYRMTSETFLFAPCVSTDFAPEIYFCIQNEEPSLLIGASLARPRHPNPPEFVDGVKRLTSLQYLKGLERRTEEIARPISRPFYSTHLFRRLWKFGRGTVPDGNQSDLGQEWNWLADMWIYWTPKDKSRLKTYETTDEMPCTCLACENEAEMKNPGPGPGINTANPAIVVTPPTMTTSVIPPNPFAGLRPLTPFKTSGPPPTGDSPYWPRTPQSIFPQKVPAKTNSIADLLATLPTSRGAAAAAQGVAALAPPPQPQTQPQPQAPGPATTTADLIAMYLPKRGGAATALVPPPQTQPQPQTQPPGPARTTADLIATYLPKRGGAATALVPPPQTQTQTQPQPQPPGPARTTSDLIAKYLPVRGGAATALVPPRQPQPQAPGPATATSTSAVPGTTKQSLSTPAAAAQTTPARPQRPNSKATIAPPNSTSKFSFLSSLGNNTGSGNTGRTSRDIKFNRRGHEGNSSALLGNTPSSTQRGNGTPARQSNAGNNNTNEINARSQSGGQHLGGRERRLTEPNEALRRQREFERIMSQWATDSGSVANPPVNRGNSFGADDLSDSDTEGEETNLFKNAPPPPEPSPPPLPSRSLPSRPLLSRPLLSRPLLTPSRRQPPPPPPKTSTFRDFEVKANTNLLSRNAPPSPEPSPPPPPPRPPPPPSPPPLISFSSSSSSSSSSSTPPPRTPTPPQTTPPLPRSNHTVSDAALGTFWPLDPTPSRPSPPRNNTSQSLSLRILKTLWLIFTWILGSCVFLLTWAMGKIVGFRTPRSIGAVVGDLGMYLIWVAGAIWVGAWFWLCFQFAAWVAGFLGLD